MIPASNHRTRPRRKRSPTARDQAIYLAYCTAGLSQASLAKDHRLSQRRIAQIIQRVEHWRSASASAPAADQPAFPQESPRLERWIDHHRLQAIYDRAIRSFDTQPPELKSSRQGDRDGQPFREQAARDQPPNVQLLKVALRAAESLSQLTAQLPEPTIPRGACASPPRTIHHRHEGPHDLAADSFDDNDDSQLDDSQPEDSHFEDRDLECDPCAMTASRQGPAHSAPISSLFAEQTVPVPPAASPPAASPPAASFPAASFPLTALTSNRTLKDETGSEPIIEIVCEIGCREVPVPFFQQAANSSNASNASNSNANPPPPAMAPAPLATNPQHSTSAKPPAPSPASSPPAQNIIPPELTLAERRALHQEKLVRLYAARRAGLPILLEFDPADGPLPSPDYRLDGA